MSVCRWMAAIALTIAATVGLGAVVGSVRGVVHDPQHRPLAGAEITLKARNADFTTQTSANNAGEFAFAAVPPGEYTVTVQFDGLQPVTQAVSVTSNSAPVLHFALAIVAKNQTVTVTDTAEAEPEPATTVVTRGEIARTPGATRTNSLAMITDEVPGAYMVHDQLHVRGGHQVSWLIDGIPVPNTNIASNVGPQFDPKDIDSLEVQRGDLSAEYGDRAYGVFNAVTRSGFERNHEGELVLNYGSYGQTNSQINFGDHTQTFAWYASVSGNRTDAGLETPTTAILHDMNDGQSGFLSLIWNRSSSDQFRVVGSARNDFYQVPNDAMQQANGVADTDREHDAFVNAAWVHTSSPDTVYTVAPFFHLNHAAYDGRGENVVPTQDRTSEYAGLVAMATVAKSGNNLHAGLQAFGEHEAQFFGVFDNTSSSAVQQRVRESGGVEALFAEDEYRPWSWLAVSGGLRLTHFDGGLSENAADPRVGAKFTLPRLKWTLHGFYGRYYQPPPLATVGGPILELAAQQGFGFLPLRGERDEQREFGLAIPWRGWTFDITNFQTHARNFFDHDVLGNSNIFFPLTIERARIHGTEITLRSPRLWKRLQGHLAFSRQWVEGFGGVSGGLTDFSPPEDAWFYLDHDQRNTVATGVNVDLPWRAWVSANFSYGSGFLDGDGPGHLASNNTMDVALSKAVGERWTLGLTVINLGNHRFLIDRSNTFGGTHWSEPRQVVGEVRWRFGG